MLYCVYMLIWKLWEKKNILKEIIFPRFRNCFSETTNSYKTNWEITKQSMRLILENVEDHAEKYVNTEPSAKHYWCIVCPRTVRWKNTKKCYKWNRFICKNYVYFITTCHECTQSIKLVLENVEHLVEKCEDIKLPAKHS